jgi:hypothetical protein
MMEADELRNMIIDAVRSMKTEIADDVTEAVESHIHGEDMAGLLRTFRSAPGAIRAASRNLRLAKEDLHKAERDLKFWKIKEAEDIYNMPAEGGGKAFTNETHRSAELARRKQVNPEYKKLVADVAARRYEVDRKTEEHQYQRDLLRSAECLLEEKKLEKRGVYE